MHPRRVQSFYTRLGLPALSFLRKPTSYVSTWSQTNPAGIGNGARYMGPTAGTSQKSVTYAWTAVTNDGNRYTLAHAQFLSDPMVRQTVAAANWTVAFAQRTANAGATYQWAGVAALHVIDGRTGTRRATVFNVQAVGAQLTNADERTCWSNIVSGAAFELFTGDYFALEMGVWIVNTGAGAVVPQSSVFSDGATDIVTPSGVVTADPRAAVFAPVYFTTALPEPGEPPSATVESAEAIHLFRGALPHNTFHDFDDSTSPDYELLAATAEVLKRYGWDMLDLLNRELDPRRAILKLADHRAVLGITQDPPTLPEQRALVLARWREYGGPTSLFGVAAAVGVVLGYAVPSQLEIMEISADQLRTALEHVPTFGGAIPEDVGFASTNFVYRSPFLTDGGAMWPAGAFLRLGFDVAAGKQVHARLTGPDGTTKTWSPITRWQEVTRHILYGKEFAGCAVHGNWTVNIYREVGSPAVSLTVGGGPLGPGWSIYVAGAPLAYVGPEVDAPLGPPQPAVVPNVVRNAGQGRHKFWWGVFADSTKISIATAADFGAARQALGRVRHGYQKADLILSKAPTPTDSGTAMTSGSQALPDMCVPS